MVLEKITTQQMEEKGVCSAPDVLSGSPAQNKAVFDRMMRELMAPAYNAAVDAINALENTEDGVKAAEALRVAAEKLRAAAETARAEAESGRAEAEQQRQAAETQRQDLETGYVARSENGAKASESWAVGGTGTREGEDTNNAKYWSEQAAAAAGGGVMSFNGRTGSVVPQNGDYSAEQVGAVASTEKGAANGVATLGEDGKLPGTQIPAITKKATVTLSTDWTGTESPYMQAVTIDGTTANSKVDLQADSTVIQQMIYDETVALYVVNNNGALTAYAVGDKPSIALTIQSTITEVSA